MFEKDGASTAPPSGRSEHPPLHRAELCPVLWARPTYTSPKISKGKKMAEVLAMDAAKNVGTKSWYFTIT